MKPSLYAVILVVVSIVVVVALGFWPQASRHGQGQSLREAADIARRLHSKAVSLMGGPKFKAGQQLPPVYGAVKETDITVLEVTVQNPNALAALEKAEALLAVAIRENPAAEKVSKTMAYGMLGRVLALKGCYQEFAAGNAIRRADEQLTKMDRAIANLRGMTAVVKHLAPKAQASDSDVEKVKSTAEDVIRSLTVEIEAQKRGIGGLDKQRNAQLELVRVHGNKASELREKVATATGAKGRQLLEKSLKERSIAGKAAREIDDIDFKMHNARSRLAQLTLAASLEGKRKETAAKLLDDRAKERAAVRENLGKAGEIAAAERKNIENIAQALMTTCRDVDRAEQAAEVQYKAAVEAMKKSRGFSPPTGAAEAAGAQAEIMMGLAKMYVSVVEICRSVGDLADRLKDLWEGSSLPGQVPQAEEMARFATRIEQAKEDASGNYKRAAEIYKEAALLAKPQLRWSYQCREYQTQVGRHRLTGDPGARERAEEIRSQLASLREFSYVAKVLEDKP
ncbi:MAG: hypothetical protein QF577_00635 [Phycisphaerae bacterium]|nr:hypothetical protein [Phycisphaerae bacterium]